MPRYFFDVQDGECYGRDDQGMDLPDVGSVWEIAVPMVDDIAKSKHHMHPPYTISVVVRDAADVVVYRSDQVMKQSASKDDHACERPISDGPNARPRNEPIGQTAEGLPDDMSKVVDITPEEETKIADKIVNG